MNPGAKDVMLAGTVLITTSNVTVGTPTQAHPVLRCTSELAVSQLVHPALCNSIVVGSQLHMWPPGSPTPSRPPLPHPLSSTCRGQDCPIAVQLAPDCEGTIPPVLNFKANSQDNSSALRPAPLPSAPASNADLRSTITPTALVELEAPWPRAGALREVPCPPSHPHGLMAEPVEGGLTSQVNLRENAEPNANTIIQLGTHPLAGPHKAP